jgi:hypothetical protein
MSMPCTQASQRIFWLALLAFQASCNTYRFENGTWHYSPAAAGLALFVLLVEPIRLVFGRRVPILARIAVLGMLVVCAVYALLMLPVRYAHYGTTQVHLAGMYWPLLFLEIMLPQAIIGWEIVRWQRPQWLKRYPVYAVFAFFVVMVLCALGCAVPLDQLGAL